ncbi:hypothetical protein GBA52_021643 [Prunus armeniaca]|nr:hypothetical protein GBA52_021643 [Prunus armeniaca]
MSSSKRHQSKARMMDNNPHILGGQHNGYQINYYSNELQIDHNKWAGKILESTGRQYEAHYHLLYPNEQHITDYWLNCTSDTNNPLYLTVYGSIKIMAYDNMCTLVFTELGVTLQDWISPNLVVFTA